MSHTRVCSQHDAEGPTLKTRGVCSCSGYVRCTCNAVYNKVFRYHFVQSSRFVCPVAICPADISRVHSTCMRRPHSRSRLAECSPGPTFLLAVRATLGQGFAVHACRSCTQLSHSLIRSGVESAVRFSCGRECDGRRTNHGFPSR